MLKTVVRNLAVIIINSILVNIILVANLIFGWALATALDEISGATIMYMLPIFESMPAMLIITLINKKAYENDDICENQFWTIEIISIIILIITSYAGYMLMLYESTL